MQSPDYREALEDAARALHQAEILVFEAMVNVGFKGQYEDISKVHEIGEVVDLELAMFEDTGDTNLDALVHTIKEIAIAKQQLINLNALDIEFED